MSRFAQRTPSPPLDRFVELLWANERPALGHARERLLPTGSADVVIALADAPIRRFTDELDGSPASFRVGLVSGPTDRPVFRDTSAPASVVGIHFRPFGLEAFVRDPVVRLTGKAIALDDVFGADARDLRDRLAEIPSLDGRLVVLERTLLDRLAGRTTPDLVVAHAVTMIERAPATVRMADLYRSSGYSNGAFIDRFARVVGLSPKRFARIARLQLAMRRLQHRFTAGENVASIASASGYSNQAHLVREMRTLTGITPSTYDPIGGHTNHVAASGTGKFFKQASPRSR